MLRRERSFLVGVGLALLGVAVMPASGRAQQEQTDKDAIVACMLEKSTPQDKGIMRDMIVSALQEDEAAMRTNLNLLGDVLYKLAVEQCGMSSALMNEQDFGEIGERYGDKMGTALIEAAFAKLK